MKILLTSDWPVSAINGVAISIKNLYRELKKLGHQVRVVSLSDNSEYYRDGDFYYIKSFDFPVYPEVKATLNFYNSYVNELVRWKPDLVHSQCEFFTYTIANTIATRAQCPIVHTYHTLYEHLIPYISGNIKLSQPIIKQLMKLRLRDADIIIAPTEKVYNKLKKFGEDRVVVLPTGIDLSKYGVQVSQEEKNALRLKHGIDPDKKILLILGRISIEKNYDEALANFYELSKLRDDVILLLVGSGPDHYIEELKAAIKNYGIQDRVIFTGRVDPSETVKYYKLAHIFISASTNETQGLTYIEALASSLPEVCKDDEALEGVIDHGYNSFVYKNTEEYIHYINLLLDDEDLRLAMAKRAQESSEKFSMENFGLNAEKVYAKALSKYEPRKFKSPLMVYDILVEKNLIPSKLNLEEIERFLRSRQD